MSKDKTTYELVVKKQRIEVSEEIYEVYYKCKEREKYIDKLNQKYTVSLEKIMDEGYHVEMNGFNFVKESVEDEAIKNIGIREMIKSLKKLEPDELVFIKEIYEKGFTEKEVAQRLGVTQQTVNYRKMTILKKLRNLLKDF